jgi:phosphopantothenoylcysteine decarboxylase / phosphopantothenate---cysteine ligase
LRKTDQAILWSKLYHLFPFPGWRCFSSFVKNSKTTEISRSLFTNLKSKRLLDFIWSSCQVVVLLAGELWSDSWAFLRQHHYTACGYLACGDTGAGKMPEPEELLDHIIHEIAYPKNLTGKKILVTAGPTREALDPVRFLTNHSTGKMGYAIARVAAARGAEVTLVTGPTEIKKPGFVKVVPIESAREMYEAVTAASEEQDAIIKAAAVADYRPAHVSDEKIKKKDGDELSIPVERTDDILAYLGSHKKPGQFLCGFSMETEHMLENSRKKLEKKNLDMIVANNLKVAGAGFGTDTNIVTLITKVGERQLEKMSKEQVADKLLDAIFQIDQ